MPRKKGPVTVEYVLAQAAGNEIFANLSPKEQERRERREREMMADSWELISAIREEGITITNVWDLLDPKYIPLPSDVVTLLLEFLPKAHHHMVQEGIVRAIGTVRVPYDGRPLRRSFDLCESEINKWVIGDTLSLTTPVGIEDWILDTLRNRKHGWTREMFCIAAARSAPEKAKDVLREIFDEMPGPAAKGLAKCGGPEEIGFLKEKAKNPEGWYAWVKKAVASAIRQIERRCERERIRQEKTKQWAASKKRTRKKTAD